MKKNAAQARSQQAPLRAVRVRDLTVDVAGSTIVKAGIFNAYATVKDVVGEAEAEAKNPGYYLLTGSTYSL